MSRVSRNRLTDGEDISHSIMPQTQLPSSVTEAKLNFYDNIPTITFTERVLDIDAFLQMYSHYHNPSLLRKNFPNKKFPIISMQKTRKNPLMRKYCRWAVLSLAAPFSGLV